MILSTIALLLSITFAALIATPLVVGLVQAGSGTDFRTPVGLVFAALLLTIYAILESLLRNSFPETRIIRLGAMDNVLGFVFSIPWALMILAIFALTIGYMSNAFTNVPDSGLFGNWVGRSGLVELLREFFRIPASLIQIIFSGRLPQPLASFVSG